MKDLASHIMDIVQNSIRAEAQRIEIRIDENILEDQFTIEIRDDGSGMDEATLQKIKDPFFTTRTVRKVGLGIPLLQQNTEHTGGDLTVTSSPHEGTTVKAVFRHSHPDRPPLGDMADTILLLTVANPLIHFSYTHSTPKGIYTFDTQEICRVLEEVPLVHPEILSSVREMIQENLNSIQAGRYFPCLKK